MILSSLNNPCSILHLNIRTEITLLKKTGVSSSSEYSKHMQITIATIPPLLNT